jgi:hypothetical protein
VGLNREAPQGFVIVDAEKWRRCFIPETAIRDLSESQLAKIGLQSETAWRESQGQEALGL